MTEAKEASSKRGRRGPYAKSDAVRDRILDACLELFAQSGFYGTTMKDVAAAA
ncbi:helix-turn-helix transcriptional regulator, partial [Pseudomonas sp. BGM005]|nr:helix-turn-helix transcriptional regulator [Pseudomonas sp. BG5]